MSEEQEKIDRKFADGYRLQRAPRGSLGFGVSRSTPEGSKEYRRLYEQRFRLEFPEKWKSYLKNKHLRKTYGISLAEKIRMFDEQKGLCAACGRKGDLDGLSVDHDHRTGLIRGLLCDRCNVALGFLDDNLNNIAKLYHYLKKHLIKEKETNL